jgi:cell division protein FtsQ
MARKSGSTILQEELYPHADEAARPQSDDSRLLDLDVEQESPFLRAQKRVSVRRATLPKKTATRLAWIAAALGVLCIAGLAAAAIYRYGEHSWRFRVESSDDIEIAGLHNVSRSQVIEVMGEDIGRNIFFIPLGERQKQLEQIPWVESASVMRFVPNRLKIEIHERTPTAFARVGSRIFLIDPSGVLMDLPVGNRSKFSFPVVLGMNHGEPLSTRAARMKTYNQLVGELDSGGARYSQNLSEVDLSDPDDIKVLASDPGGEVLIHLGSSDFLDRFKIYVSHIQEWRQQFARLNSVDLRYEHQIVVNPDLEGSPKQAPLSPAAAKAAMEVGVKPAMLVTSETKTANIPPKQSRLGWGTGAKKKAARRARKTAARSAAAKSSPVQSLSAAQATPPSINATKPSKPSPAISQGQVRQ